MKHSFRWEIMGVLAVKGLLLWALWWVVFRPEGHPLMPQAPIAEHFMLPSDLKPTEFVDERR